MEKGARLRMQTIYQLENRKLPASAATRVQSAASRLQRSNLDSRHPSFVGIRHCLLVLLCGALFSAAQAQTQPPPPDSGTAQSDDNDLGPGYPRLDAPWSGGPKKSKTTPAPAPAPAPAPKQETAPPPADVQQPPPDTAAAPVSPLTGVTAVKARIRKNEISASGDFFLGSGNV